MNPAAQSSAAPTEPSMDEIYGVGSDMILHVIDEVSDIARIENLNGPAGRQLGRYIAAELRGRAVADLTIRELREICDRSRRDYNAMFRADETPPAP